MTNIKYLFIPITLAMAGCAASVEPMPTPSGKEGFSVSCNGAIRDWADCYKAAANACNGEYKIIDTASSASDRVRRSLVVECAK